MALHAPALICRLGALGGLATGVDSAKLEVNRVHALRSVHERHVGLGAGRDLRRDGAAAGKSDAGGGLGQATVTDATCLGLLGQLLLLLLLSAEIAAGLVALGPLTGDALGGEGAEGQDDDDRGECEGPGFEIGKLGPLEPSKDGGYDHEGAVGHDEHFHGVDERCGRQDAAVLDEVADELDVEDGAEPKDGNGAHDDRPVDAPEEVLWRDGRHDGVVLDNGEREPGADRQEDDDGRQRAGDVARDARPKGHHGPGLVHEGGLHDDDERQRERVGGQARVPVARGDLRKVVGPDLVKVAKRGDEVGKEQAGADDAEREADDVQHGRQAAELGDGCEGEHDEQHDEAGAELGAVVERHAQGLVVVGVEDGYGHRRRRDVVGEEEGDVAGEAVKRRIDVGRRCAVHGRKGSLVSGLWVCVCNCDEMSRRRQTTSGCGCAMGGFACGEDEDAL